MEQTVEATRPDLLDRDGLQGLAYVLEAAAQPSRTASRAADVVDDPYSIATA